MGGTHLYGNTKHLRKYKKKEEKTQKIIYYLNSGKTMKTSFYYYKKMVFENTKNTKNKNTLPSPNNFFVFFVFKNKEQFLKRRTKQTLRPCLVAIFINYFGKQFLF